MTSLLRTLFWFEPGERSEIIEKLFRKKWEYDAQREPIVLLPLLAAGLGLALLSIIYCGLVYLWILKFAIQALNQKKFFDPLP